MTHTSARRTRGIQYGPQSVTAARLSPVLFAAILLAALPGSALATTHRSAAQRSAAVALRVSVGWNNWIRSGPTWVPVRVTVTNHAHIALHAVVEIPDSATVDQFGMQRPLGTLYQEPIVVPARSTREATLYLPGADIAGEVVVRLRDGGTVLGTRVTFPVAFPDRHLLVALLSADLSGVSWLQRIRFPRVPIDVVSLSTATLDPVPQALAAFDLIVVSNVDSSQLTEAQRSALELYVRSGGSLLVVGGPYVQEAVQSLPRALMPGHLISSLALRTPSRLCTLDGVCTQLPPTVVSRMHPAPGSLALTYGALPLAVAAPLGAGWTEYLAFDPASAGLSGRSGQAVLSTLFRESVPGAMRLRTYPEGFPKVSFRSPGAGVLNMDRALRLPPVHRQEPLLPAVLLVCGYGALLALMVNGRKRRRARWVTIPLLAVLLWNVTATVAGSGVYLPETLNTLAMVEMDGSGPTYPTTVYMSVSTRQAGRYHVHWTLPALVQTMGQSGLDMQTPRQVPGWRIAEGAGTTLDLLTTGSEADHVIALTTDVPMSGGLSTSLRLNDQGLLVGTIHNGTDRVLVRPALLAGDAVSRLPDLGPGASVLVRVRPHERLTGLNGSEAVQGAYTESPGSGALSAHIWTALQALPEAALVHALGPVTLVGWTTGLPGVVTVNGSTPEEHMLVLIAKRVDVGVESPGVHLPAGVAPVSLVDITPHAPSYTCCGPDVQSMYIDRGGIGTVLVQLPRGLSTHPRSLIVRAAPGSSGPVSPEQYPVPPGMIALYDWDAGSWKPLSFHGHRAGVSGNRHGVSATGVLLLRLRTTPDSGQIFLADPQRELQIGTEN